MKSVLISGADRGVGLGLAAEFASHGWRVFAGQFMPEWPQLSELKEKYPDNLVIVPLDVSSSESVRAARELVGRETDRIDLLASNAGIGHLKEDRESMTRVFSVNSLALVRLISSFRDLLDRGDRRVCAVSSEAGSITLAMRPDMYSYCMSKTALNMELRLLFNELRPQGYTFRVYHPGWVRSYMSGKKSTVGYFEPEETAAVAYRQFTEGREVEDVLYLMDIEGEVWAF